MQSIFTLRFLPLFSWVQIQGFYAFLRHAETGRSNTLVHLSLLASIETPSFLSHLLTLKTNKRIPFSLLWHHFRRVMATRSLTGTEMCVCGKNSEKQKSSEFKYIKLPILKNSNEESVATSRRRILEGEESPTGRGTKIRLWYIKVKSGKNSAVWRARLCHCCVLTKGKNQVTHDALTRQHLLQGEGQVFPSSGARTGKGEKKKDIRKALPGWGYRTWKMSNFYLLDCSPTICTVKNQNSTE